MHVSQGVLALAICLGVLLSTVTAATCPGRVVNETEICQNVNSTGLLAQLPLIVPGNLSQYACGNASDLLALNSSNILYLLNNISVNINLTGDQLILFFSKINGTALESALESFNSQTVNTSVVPSKDLFLMALWETKLRNESQYNQTEFVTAWFQARLRPFLSAISTSILQCLQNISMGCQQYQEVLKGLNMEFDSMALEKQRSVFSGLVFPYLQRINSTSSSGSVCAGTSSNAWLTQNFQRFSMFANYKDLTSLNTNFNGLDALKLLTATQIADVTVESAALNSTDNITSIFDILQNRTYAELKEYYTRLTNRTLSPINSNIQNLMLNKTLELLFPKMKDFKTLDYTEWFQRSLPILLPNLTSAQLTQIFTNVSCDSYQSVVTGLDATYQGMTNTKQDIYGALNGYLINHTIDGVACLNNATNNSIWLQKNFGQFRSYGLFQDFVRVNKNFTGLDSLDILTVKQLAQLSASNGTLKTPNDVQKVMRFVNSSVIIEYMDEFNNQSNITLPENVKSELLFQVLTAFEPQRQKEMASGNFLSPYLYFLLPGLNSTSLPLLFNDLSTKNCSALFNLTNQLNSSNSRFTNTTQFAIYNQILNFTKDPSLPCYNSSSSFTKYLKDTFQGYSTFLNLDDAFSMVPSARLSEVVNSMAPVEFVDMFKSSDFINNDSLLTLLLTKYNQTSSFIDEFNNRTIVNSLSNKTKTAILEGMWPAIVSNGNDSDLDKWFDSRLQPYFLFINKDLLNSSPTQNANCRSFRKIVNKLGTNLTDFKGQEKDFYSSIKTYLSAGVTDTPRCYNSSDSSWLSSYLGPFIQYSSEDDIRGMVPDESILQNLSTNQKNIDLINNIAVPDEVASLFASTLFVKDPNFNISSLPNKLLCFSKDSAALKNQKPDQLLSIIVKINTYCGNVSSSSDSTSSRQLASVLVGQFTSVNSTMLKNLGQQAVGLNTGQIAKMNIMDVQNSIADLGKVRGWDAGQAQGLVGKLLASNILFADQNSFVQLGSLVNGMPSRIFSNMPNEVAVNLTSNAEFVSNIATAPVYVQQTFVNKVCSAAPTDFANKVPDSLAGAIPNSLLFGNLPDIKTLSNKKWSKDQAAIVFSNSLKPDSSDFNNFSASILQGFQCNSGSKLASSNFRSLISQIKDTNTILDSSQLNCLAKLSTKHSVNYSAIPGDVLLFIDMDNMKGDCTDFFNQASQGNANNLAQNPVQVDKLLNRSSSCLNINGTTLTKDQLRGLGGLVCYMDPATIRNSDPQIVENLKKCQDLNNNQQTELVNVFKTNKTQYGAPSTWNRGTFEALDPLLVFMNNGIFSSLKQSSKKNLFQKFVGRFKTQSSQQNNIQKCINSLLSPASTRQKRAAGCTAGNITSASIIDPLFLLTYSTYTEFDSCLDDSVLLENLAAFAAQPLPDSYLQIMKTRLDKIYPQGLPEDKIKLMGSALSRLYTAAEISKWNITSSDTLTILLSSSYPPWNESQTKQILTRYLQSGNNLTAPVLKNIKGQSLCTLDAAQISNISANALKDAGTLNISACSQDKQDILYATAKTAFDNQKNSSAYYSMIQPYLGGAPAADLKNLAQSNISMDIQTFIGLKASEREKLSVTEVANLLGTNVADLKTYQENPAVKNWTALQFQTDLDKLGIGLIGGKPPTSAPPATSIILVASKEKPVGYIAISVYSGSVPSGCSLQTVVLTLGVSVFRRFL